MGDAELEPEPPVTLDDAAAVVWVDLPADVLEDAAVAEGDDEEMTTPLQDKS